MWQINKISAHLRLKKTWIESKIFNLNFDNYVIHKTSTLHSYNLNYVHKIKNINAIILVNFKSN